MENHKCNLDSEVKDIVIETVDYRKERRRVILTVGVLAAWVCFVLAVVTRANAAALTKESLSMEYIAPLLFVLLAVTVILIIFCLPSHIKGEEEEVLNTHAMSGDHSGHYKGYTASKIM